MGVIKTDILLETGTNELEIMEFTIADQTFGINVAKVREILTYRPVKAMQNANIFIEGIFKPREDIITVIDLAAYLSLPESQSKERDIFIVANFNQMSFAFHVHSVVGIDRISWSKIQKPDKIIYGGDEGVATGIAEFEDRLITILDFEKIVTEISPHSSIQSSDIDVLGERNISDKCIVVAEDSTLLSKLIIDSLHKAGYTNTVKADNGQEVWDFLEEIKAAGKILKECVSCIITDIEMPRMDGHRLTKLIKEDDLFKNVPVILFSSLINEEMYLKGKQIGADSQVSKPQIVNLVHIIDELIEKYDS